MATRRDAREWAVQMLFQLDLNPTTDLGVVFESFWADKEPDARGRRFAEGLVTGVNADRLALDATIQGVSGNWDVRRMGVLDRNVIRMALYEMLHHDDVPPAVTINEAVDIAKYFSSSESGKFVNGVLDRIRKDLHLAPRRRARREGQPPAASGARP